ICAQMSKEEREAWMDSANHTDMLAVLLQHHLYQHNLWWLPGRQIESDLLWKNLMKDVELTIEQPLWFCENPLSLIVIWIDEFLIANKKSNLVRTLAIPDPTFLSPRLVDLPPTFESLFRECHKLKCPNCKQVVSFPVLCLICGTVYPTEHSETKCCDRRTRSAKQHIIECSGGLNLSISIDSSKTLIQRENKYAKTASLYLDEHGEEDVDLRRGKRLYLNDNRLKSFYSSWISSSLDQNVSRWSNETFQE
ncbi:unnamed protein product, partial [Didymodactylos carnosus]